MTKQDFSILFMGTPDFAVASLQMLTERGKNIIAVVTAPDKPAGRGRELTESPVKKYAMAKGIKVLQPEKLKDPAFLLQLNEMNPSLIVVVAFRMLPKDIWQIPESGTINLHASLLPQYRGAAPINHAIMKGETRTGVTTFFIEEEIDTGKILLQKEVQIRDSDNAKSLHDKLMTEGALLLDETVNKLMNKELTAVDQKTIMHPEMILHPAPKIFREHCRINWDLPLKDIHNLIRGLSPVPAAWTEMHTGKDIVSPVKIFETGMEFTATSLPAGKLFTDGKTFLKATHPEGFLHLLSLQIPGKKQLAVQEFLKGFRLDETSRFI